ncbi:hypothetical protein ACN28S_37890 [Cystobacter fuscus]
MPHAELRLEAVAVELGEVLPGDGYVRFLKPFRTVEDCHVFAAVLGWLLQVARRSGWPDEVREGLLALAVMMRGLAQMDPASPEVHRRSGGRLACSASAWRRWTRSGPRWMRRRASAGSGTARCSRSPGRCGPCASSPPGGASPDAGNTPKQGRTEALQAGGGARSPGAR